MDADVLLSGNGGDANVCGRGFMGVVTSPPTSLLVKVTLA